MSGIRDAWENARGWAARFTSREPAQPEVQCEWGDHHLHDAGMVDDLGQCPGLPREPQFDRPEWEDSDGLDEAEDTTPGDISHELDVAAYWLQWGSVADPPDFRFLKDNGVSAREALEEARQRCRGEISADIDLMVGVAERLAQEQAMEALPDANREGWSR